MIAAGACRATNFSRLHHRTMAWQANSERLASTTMVTEGEFVVIVVTADRSFEIIEAVAGWSKRWLGPIGVAYMLC